MIVQKGLKKKNFKNDLDIWVPLYLISNENIKRISSSNNSEKTVEGFVDSLDDNKLEREYSQKTTKFASKSFNPILFGKKYKNISRIDNVLNGFIYYLDPGHGGPDPGAIGNNGDHELTEDEYAYDITLRLANNLMKHGATVFMTILDSNNGIRDEEFLKNNSNEYFGNGVLITGNPKERLQKRIDFINQHSSKYKRKNQRLIVIHVDSRIVEQRIDVFFYYKPGDSVSKKYAENIMDIIGKKYELNQPGRGYEGNVSERNLYMLRYSPVLSVYLELGNIQNPKDQIRFLDPNNRQAIANWICSGIIFNDRGNILSKKDDSKKHKIKRK